MNVLVIEDEELSSRQLVQYLTAHDPAARVVQVVRSIAKGLAWFAANPMPDLIFSDIELLDGNVFALYQQVPVTCPIIFVTAYDQFLLPAFRGNGIAYLLKPFTAEQFAQTLDKYHQLRRSLAPAAGPAGGLSAEVLAQLTQAMRPALPAYKQRFSVRQRNSLYILPVEDVVYLQADEGLVFAIDRQGTRHPLTGTLTELERQLDPAQFGRLNRSELVNISFVEKVEPYFNNRLLVKLRPLPAATLTTSTAQTPEFRRWLEG
ncbi:LytTR family DNA-binding domain-containing protein [Hymenobacter sp. 15J16-1T3B]|uniref:LytR/AlgR family response regulator transcription factor n=1 Tax=Hymenobacter sp. 15J16-1T3B TaxID=2886941 RepID=UPI001D10BE31|nr:LytTR family DNA-binding domain-containing protein [Hymenobacter sp. 15J16-1T3B]MCC3156554.1 LytTR family DNA-binding domain-containing protein [Hymenobacter sp. 15J16-1T3B]